MVYYTMVLTEYYTLFNHSYINSIVQIRYTIQNYELNNRMVISSLTTTHKKKLPKKKIKILEKKINNFFFQ